VDEGVTRRLFEEMLREEWRMHTELFGGRRFAAFPVAIALIVAGAIQLLVSTGTIPGTVLAGLHVLAVVVGTHTGSIAVVGRDAVHDLLGEMTLLIFSARTLPVSEGRLLGVFIVKDIVYYAALFLLPMAVGSIPALLGGGMAPSAILGSTALLWATLTLAFVTGITITLAGIGLISSKRRGLGMGVGLGIIAWVVWWMGIDVVHFTPYGVYTDPSATGVAVSLLVILGLGTVGALTFDPSPSPSTRTVPPVFGRILSVLRDPVAAKSLLDLHRSGGGVWKIFFSGAILLGVTAALVDLAARMTGVTPSGGISFGTILGLSGFTTYNWLTIRDELGAYQSHPLSVSDVYTGKFRVFILLGPLVGLLFYVMAMLWRGGSLTESVVGAILLIGVASYVFGITVALTGVEPSEFLFDTVLFVTFGFAMMVPLVPILVVGFVLVPVSDTNLVALGVFGGVLTLTGVALFRWSIPRWTRYHRQ
jgi:hypothetical protein